ncbi:hypothetical protein PtA15_13A142 [Puccinia triticina]|uniref:Uncharacterized protein n=1 Tax=Puccinia triticina TaxID=208348 RepID=A0ABY7CZJ8_9BASI|nr:uncharacterized protein PtA15_13A142 [Puccinia triticina]WAQ90743.1 hypothetical protein PtA15_13A142 [Puccinia triticina]
MAENWECHYASSILGWLRNPPSGASTFPGGQYFYQSQLAHLHLFPPPIKLSASNHPSRVDRGIGMGHKITQVWKNALKDIELSVLWLTNQDPIQGWYKGCARNNDPQQQPTPTSSKGKWLWQPTHDGPKLQPMTVHKQGSLEVKCERVFYERKQAGGKRSRGSLDG